MPNRARDRGRPHPGAYFLVDVLVIAFLVNLALGSTADPAWKSFPIVWPSFAFEPVIPLWVPWGGAIGGATISLVGVARHAHEWDAARYRWWHLSRPFLGAVSGTFAVLLIVFVLRGVAPELSADGFDAKGIAVLTGIAFVVGYREETFRELIKRVVDLILRPAASPAAGTVAFVPSEVDLGTVATGSPAVAQVRLFNASLDTVHVSTSMITPNRPEVTWGGTETDLAPDTSWNLSLTWTPTSEGPLRQQFTLPVGGRVVTLLVLGAAEIASIQPPRGNRRDRRRG